MSKVHRGFLADCEKEELQYSGSIQSYGALLILSKEFDLLHFSENFEDLTGLNPQTFAKQVADGTILAFLSSASHNTNTRAESHNSISNNFASGNPGARLELEEGFESDRGVFDLIITRGVENQWLIEFFEHNVDSLSWISPPDFSGVYDLSNLQSLREKLVYWIAEVTGFDRVMYYQFLEDGDGEVVAEVTKGQSIGSYLGLRFPASDIPLIARQLYLKNPWRVIQDAQAEVAKLLGDSTADLTWSDLRSVSPIHVVYMQNMGDRSSLSYPISAGQELDALISCHSQHPLHLPLKRLRGIKEVVDEFNMLLRNIKTTNRVRLVDEIAYNTHQILKSIDMMDDHVLQWQTFSEWLLEEFESDAVVWSHNQTLYTAGIPFEKQLIGDLNSWFAQHCHDLVFYKNHIKDLISDDLLTHIAGAAGLRISMQDKSTGHIFLLRTEQVDEVVWGGNPNKPVEHHDGILGIAPRQSFGKWVEKRIGFSRPWDNATRLRLLRLRDELQRSSLKNTGWLSVARSLNE